jgi:hypothetical protein
MAPATNSCRPGTTLFSVTNSAGVQELQGPLAQGHSTFWHLQSCPMQCSPAGNRAGTQVLWTHSSLETPSHPTAPKTAAQQSSTIAGLTPSALVTRKARVPHSGCYHLSCLQAGSKLPSPTWTLQVLREAPSPTAGTQPGWSLSPINGPFNTWSSVKASRLHKYPKRYCQEH